MNNKTKRKGYNKKYCSPFKKNRLSYSCLSHPSLIKIAKALNKYGCDIDIDVNDKQLYNNLKHIFKTKYKCNNEVCWIKVKELMKGQYLDLRRKETGTESFTSCSAI